MTKFKTIALITFIIASVVASLIIHAQSDSASQTKTALLQQQTQQIGALKTEQQRLSNLIARAASPPGQDHTTELAKLRAQAEALRKQSNDFAQHSKLHHSSNSSPSPAKHETHSPEYWQEMDQASGAKATDARDIAAAMGLYARDHQKQFPSSLDQLTPYLAKNHWVISGTNQFEIVYRGSIDDLDGIPESSIAGVRDTQTFLTPDGKQARAYGMIPGIGQIVTSDDNFQSWEAEHVISPPKSP